MTRLFDEEEESEQTKSRAFDPSAVFGAGARLSLLVMSENGALTRGLPRRGEVVLGRSASCDICIDDERLSRRHAVIRIQDKIEIVDLGSRNGTVVGDQRLVANVPIVLEKDVMVTIGGTAIMLQNAPSSPRAQRILAHGYFESRVEEECARAGRGGPPFAVMRVRAQDPATAPLVEEALSRLCRPGDIVGVYAPAEYEVLFCDTAQRGAEALGKKIVADLAHVDVKAVCGVAAFPIDGSTAEELVQRAGPGRGAAQERVSERQLPAGGAPSPGVMQRLDPMVRRVAGGEISVLVLGETGSGKEVLARRIHTLSARSSKPLLTINCAALSDALLESELFGHERGSFTGAMQTKIGLLESADGGTVFLDEVGEMSLTLQAKLLRVLEQREILRVGSLKPRRIDVRFISATNRDLEGEGRVGRFRTDLYFRLNGVAIVLPPLRERLDEIEPLARAFIEESLRKAGKSESIDIDAEAMALLHKYQWPGNIRELRNMIERAVLLSSGNTITREHLPVEKMGAMLPARAPFPMLESDLTPAAPPGLPPMRPPMPTQEAWEHPTQRDLGSGVTAPPPAPGAQAGPGRERAGREEIIAALAECAGNQSQAAKLLGISRRTLVTRIEEYALPRPRKK